MPSALRQPDGGEGELRELWWWTPISRRSLARQRFTDQMGLITAAFYAPTSATRGLGTARQAA